MSHLMNTYGRLPVAFDRGEGCWLYDTEGKAYLDALAGIAVNTLGYRHPDLVRAIADQAEHVLHTSNLYRIPNQEALSDKLAEISGMDEVFFCNSGCEANEAAIKLARFYGHTKGIECPTVIVMEHAFHGRTLATMAATANAKVKDGFGPEVQGFLRVPYDDIAAVRAHVGNSDVVAVMLEVVQGEGGIASATDGYLRELRALCDEQGWLMMCDEVQCGIGRTGKWFAFQHAGVLPDVVSLAKGLGSGVPIGACLAAGRAAGLFHPGNHGSTFGGNPLATRAALTTLEVVERDHLLEHAVHAGQRLREGLQAALAGVKGVVELRGRGLMLGIVLDRPCGAIVVQALEAGLLINVTAGQVIRLLPPLVFGDEEVDLLVERLAPLVRDFLSR